MATNAAGTTFGADQTFTTGHGGGPGTRHSARAHLSSVTAKPIGKGCVVGYRGAGAASDGGKPACTKALVTFSGTIATGADGQLVTIVLHTRIHGRKVVITAHTRVEQGRFTFRLKLPGRDIDITRHHKRINGSQYTFTITYPGNGKLRPGAISGKFMLEPEPAQDSAG